MTQSPDRARAEAELFEFLRIPSVSTDPGRAADVRRAAGWLSARLAKLGFRTELLETAGHPAVFAERTDHPTGSGVPTVLIYGHYDVQPAEPLEKWTTDPFEPAVRDGRVFARGASDDKGQVLAHVLAADRLLGNGGLPVNLKFLVEGEEEVGSRNLGPVLDAHRERLACDVVVISDGSMFAPGVPTLTTGLRGISYLEVLVQGAVKDLHSGSYGGAVANPISALVSMLATLKDQDGRITVPGVMERVRPIPEAERRGWAELPFSESDYARSLEVDALPGEAGYSVLERLWGRTSLEINGIWGGFQGEGSKTVLPARAGAKVSLRLVPDQDPVEVFEHVRRHLESVRPPGVTLEVRYLHGGHPVSQDASSSAIQAGRRALERAYPGAEVRLIRGGGSIPIVPRLQEQLAAPVLLVDLGLPDDGPHGPDEKLDLESFHRGIDVAAYLLEELAAGL